MVLGGASWLGTTPTTKIRTDMGPSGQRQIHRKRIPLTKGRERIALVFVEKYEDRLGVFEDNNGQRRLNTRMPMVPRT